MNSQFRYRSKLPGICLVLCIVVLGALLPGEQPSPPRAPSPVAKPVTESPQDVLTPAQWVKVDASVDRALAWLARRQRPDGSFSPETFGEPAITSFCVMAFLSRGHLPGEGPYGATINKCVDFVLSTQKANGMLAQFVPRRGVFDTINKSAMYNHPIAGLMLSEVYGLSGKRRDDRIRSAIEKALAYTRARQIARKRRPVDRGGWRYPYPRENIDSDLSITAWHLMFLRAAKNAGFHVPSQYVDDGVEYVKRCFDRGKGTFVYRVQATRRQSRAMAGAGILSLSMAGLHQTEMAQTAGRWMLRNNFDRYNRARWYHDRYHYGAYYCTQAAFQLGGQYWVKFYPRLVRVLLRNQSRTGSWQRCNTDSRFGNAYTTALTVLTLTVPYQILPIYQR